MMKALVIGNHEDEVRLLSVLASVVGFDVSTAPAVDNGATLSLLRHVPDAIVLATRDEEALREVQAVRNLTTTPMMVIASHLRDDLHAALLDAGADLGVRRPYAARLLASQMRALARRGVASGSMLFLLPHELILDPRMRSIRVGDGPPQQLSQLEFRLLEVLLTQRGQAVSSEELVEKVWNFGPEEGTDLVRKLVNRLRSKIEPDPSNPEYVITIPGSGYALREPGLEWNLGDGLTS